MLPYLNETCGATLSALVVNRRMGLAVLFGGDGSPHLADVVAHTGLGVDEIVQRHIAPLP